MKKLILAIAIIFTIVSSSCTKENVAPTRKATTIADKANLAQCDLNTPSTPESPCIPPPAVGNTIVDDLNGLIR